MKAERYFDRASVFNAGNSKEVEQLSFEDLCRRLESGYPVEITGDAVGKRTYLTAIKAKYKRRLRTGAVTIYRTPCYYLQDKIAFFN